jgi:hypothetical protein
MLSNKRPGMEVLAALFCATTASAGQSRHTRAEGSVCARRNQALRRLHSRPYDGQSLPEAEQVRPQRRLPIGF